MPSAQVTDADAFDLPEWVGVEQVTWAATSSLGETHHVTGELRSGPEALTCDVLAADLAFPAPVLSERWRHDAHQAWAHGQVLLVHRHDRLTLVVPGSRVAAEDVLEAVRRFAKAVGATSDRFAVTLRL